MHCSAVHGEARVTRVLSVLVCDRPWGYVVHSQEDHGALKLMNCNVLRPSACRGTLLHLWHT